MDDFGNLTIPGASHGEYTLYISRDEQLILNLPESPYGGFDWDGYTHDV